MKNILVRPLAVAAAAVFINSQVAMAADTITPPTPGTPAATDSKNDSNLNNPAGPATQMTNHPKEGTKKKHHHTGASAASTTGSGNGAKATKTPQKDTAPSPANP